MSRPAHWLYVDGDDTPAIRTEDLSWRPPRSDLSWRLADDAGRTIAEHHPLKPRHAARAAELGLHHQENARCE